jgi:hypothetical protein
VAEDHQPQPGRQTEAQLVPCWHCGDDVPIDTADVHLAAHGPEWVCQECAT